MEITHDPNVAQRFPGHATGGVRVLAESGSLELARGITQSLKERLSEPNGAQRAEAAAARWQVVFDAMGAKPRYRPSLKVLVQQLAENGSDALGKGLPPIVEFYNTLSLVLAVPMAGYRSGRIAGQQLKLTFPGKGKPFTPLGRPREQEKTRAGEVAYIDGSNKVVCRYWNLSDCDETKLGEEEVDVLFIFDLITDLLPCDPHSYVDRAAAELRAAFPGADVLSAICDGVEQRIAVL